jgi:cytochrome b561
MFYQKNLPRWERILRVLAGILVIAVTLSQPLSGWLRVVIIASAAAFLFLGFIGFCPMCAMVGRKLDSKK